MSQSRCLITTAILVLFTAPVQAEVISIANPDYDVSNSPAGVERPSQGMSMQQVEQRFGVAQEQRSPVGDPPVTRWLYEDFTVFFEYDKVVHATVIR